MLRMLCQRKSRNEASGAFCVHAASLQTPSGFLGVGNRTLARLLARSHADKRWHCILGDESSERANTLVQCLVSCEGTEPTWTLTGGGGGTSSLEETGGDVRSENENLQKPWVGFTLWKLPEGLWESNMWRAEVTGCSASAGTGRHLYSPATWREELQSWTPPQPPLPPPSRRYTNKPTHSSLSKHCKHFFFFWW